MAQYVEKQGQVWSMAQPRARNAYHHRVFRLWILELLSLVFALGILVAVFAILAHYSGQEIPRWPLSINLNTLISILSILFRTAMLFAVAEVMGQLRWTWFQKPRLLADLYHIERAGHSAVSAGRLLAKAPRNLLVILCSIIIIVSIAIGPFMQQSVKTFACEQESAGVNASLSAANYIVANVTRIGAGQYNSDASMRGTLINGLANPHGNDSAVSFSCPTGNCTFAEYGGITHSSMGMCKICLDTTSAIPINGSSIYSNSFGNITLPNGLSISNFGATLAIGGGIGDLGWATTALTPDFAAASAWAIQNFTVLAFTSASCDKSPQFQACSQSTRNDLVGFVNKVVRPLAVSCTLYPCLKNFHASIKNGQLEETEVSTLVASPYTQPTELIFTPGLSVLNYTAVKQPCVLDGKPYDSTNFSAVSHDHAFDTAVINGANVSVPLDCLYGFNGLYAGALGQFMRGLVLNGKCAGNSDSPGYINCFNNFWLEPFWNNATADLTSIASIMDGFTTVVTNRLRESGYSFYVDGTHWLRSDIQGTVHSMSVCIQFDWKWLLLPALLVLLSIILVVSIITTNYLSQGLPVWKSSSLPLVYYGFTNGVTPCEKLNISQLEEFAGKTHVQLRTDQVVGFQCVNNSHASMETGAYDGVARVN